MSTFDLLERVRGETSDVLINRHKSNYPSTIDLEGWLGEFFDLLLNSIEAGDPHLIDPALDEWINIEGGGENPSFGNIINILLLSIFKVSQSILTAEQSQELIGKLLPVFIHANQYFHDYEINMAIAKTNQEQLSLEQLEKSKSDFISVAAHELKTPLTLMEGYSAMLREILEQKKIFEEHIFLLLDGMNSGSRRLREIINDMIDVSLIDNEMLSLTFQPSWLHNILIRIKEDFAVAVQSRQISFTVHRFNGDGILNFYDSERLFQALSNVVANAIKYTPDGGRIEVNGRLLEDFIEIAIIDNGIGIDPGDQVKIFTKLQPIGEVAFHSSGKLKFKGGGPGLGLPITKGIIEAHGGRIWVESDGYDEETCPGSTFHILLPIRGEPMELKTADHYEPLFTHKLNRDKDPKTL